MIPLRHSAVAPLGLAMKANKTMWKIPPSRFAISYFFKDFFSGDSPTAIRAKMEIAPSSQDNVWQSHSAKMILWSMSLSSDLHWNAG